MTRHNLTTDEEFFVNDVNYGIADCRKRLRARARSQRSSFRAQQNPPANQPEDLSPEPATAVEEREEALIT